MTSLRQLSSFLDFLHQQQQLFSFPSLQHPLPYFPRNMPNNLSAKWYRSRGDNTLHDPHYTFGKKCSGLVNQRENVKEFAQGNEPST